MVKKKLLKLVTLDVTNTLIKTVGSPGQQYARIALRHGVTVDKNSLDKLFFKYYKEYCLKYPNFGARNMMSAYTWWTLLVKDCFKGVDSSIGDTTLDKIANELFFYYSLPKAWEVLPGALEAVKDLHQYPILLGVISNWDHRLYKVLVTLKLRSYFDFVLPSYIIGAEKPNGIIFQQALSDAECQPDEAVHFGDSVEKDFLGARNAGIGAYLLTNGDISHDLIDPKFVVRSVPEFVTAIRPRLEEARLQHKKSSTSPSLKV